METKTAGQLHREAQAAHDLDMQKRSKKGSYGERVVTEAARLATSFAKADGLHPVIVEDDFDLRYTVRQGLRAACVGREDAAVGVLVAPIILDHLRSIQRLAWLIVAILIYIAWRLA